MWVVGAGDVVARMGRTFGAEVIVARSVYRNGDVVAEGCSTK